MTTLTTARLTLRPHRRDDFPDLHSLWSDPEVVRFIGGRPATEEESWARLLRYAGLWSLLGYGYWAVRETATGRYVGDVGFADFHRDIDPPLGPAPEAGWALMPWAHGKGLATEALAEMHRWVEKNGYGSTVCIIGPENDRSIALAQRVGYGPSAVTEYKGQPIQLYSRVPISPVGP